MKKIFAILAFILILYLPALSLGQTNETTTTASFPGVGTVKGIYNFLSSFNPVVLLVFGLVLLLASHLGKYIAWVLIIFAIIEIVLMLLHI